MRCLAIWWSLFVSGISKPVVWGPIVCTLDSHGFRHFRGFRDFR